MSQLFFRIFRHLLPDGEAWRLVALQKRLEQFVDGLASFFATQKTYLDNVYDDRFALTTRALKEWEHDYGLINTGLSDEDRRAQINAAMRERGGQSPHYMQTMLQAAGFNVFVHEWWESGPPWIARDPRNYATTLKIGTVQCNGPFGPYPYPHQPKCRSRDHGQFVCNSHNLSSNNYVQYESLANRPPPAISSDPSTWPHYIYIGAETFPEHAPVPAARRLEFLRWVLKIRPLEKWVVLLVDYEGETGRYYTDDEGKLQIIGL